MFESAQIMLNNFLPPAVLASAIGFLVWFFGNAISDQKPFSDNRKWEIYISGTHFLINVFLSFLVAMFLVSRWGYFWPLNLGSLFEINNQYLFLLFVVNLFVFLFLSIRYRKFYNIEGYGKKEIEKIATDGGNFWKIFIAPFLISLSKLLVFILLILLYKEGGWINFSYGIGLVFFYFVALAIIQSLNGQNILTADIYFKSKTEKPIKKCRILKINDDNVRIRVGDKVVLLSKDSIFKIEIKIKKK